MITKHSIIYRDSRTLTGIKDKTVQLVITSPPYPMIEMWDQTFTKLNPKIKKCLDKDDGQAAFELMHQELGKVQDEIYRVLIPGGIVCINIGDATRTIGEDFRLYPNHAKIVQHFYKLGLHPLPEIIWRKPSNSPNKFLGSGMLPCNAYVTLEHEKILVFRKPKKRQFKNDEEKINRRNSSFFWEERNKWFSDIWYLNGTRQTLNSKEVDMQCRIPI